MHAFEMLTGIAKMPCEMVAPILSNHIEQCPFPQLFKMEHCQFFFLDRDISKLWHLNDF